jgi:hypothetical protein
MATSISEIAVDRRATVRSIPALGDRGLPKAQPGNIRSLLKRLFL